MVSLESVVDVACRAADLALEMQRAGLRQVRAKEIDIDLVTEADVASERLLRDALHQLAPQIDFWGEESNTPPDSDAFWLVDPIDGTVNFAHSLGYSAVNVALVREQEIVMAVTVQMPYRRVFLAERGKGTFLRDAQGEATPLHVNDTQTLRSALLATGFPYHTGTATDDNSAEFAWFSPRCLALRVMGAAALDIAQVASGTLAGFWEGWLSPWDAAAGALLVREAGGVVTDYAGAPWHFGSPGFVASNGHIHDMLLEGIRTARTPLVERLLPL